MVMTSWRFQHESALFTVEWREMTGTGVSKGTLQKYLHGIKCKWGTVRHMYLDYGPEEEHFPFQ